MRSLFVLPIPNLSQALASLGHKKAPLGEICVPFCGGSGSFSADSPFFPKLQLEPGLEYSGLIRNQNRAFLLQDISWLELFTITSYARDWDRSRFRISSRLGFTVYKQLVAPLVCFFFICAFLTVNRALEYG